MAARGGEPLPPAGADADTRRLRRGPVPSCGTGRRRRWRRGGRPYRCAPERRRDRPRRIDALGPTAPPAAGNTFRARTGTPRVRPSLSLAGYRRAVEHGWSARSRPGFERVPQSYVPSPPRRAGTATPVRLDRTSEGTMTKPRRQARRRHPATAAPHRLRRRGRPPPRPPGRPAKSEPPPGGRGERRTRWAMSRRRLSRRTASRGEGRPGRSGPAAVGAHHGDPPQRGRAGPVPRRGGQVLVVRTATRHPPKVRLVTIGVRGEPHRKEGQTSCSMTK